MSSHRMERFGSMPSPPHMQVLSKVMDRLLETTKKKAGTALGLVTSGAVGVWIYGLASESLGWFLQGLRTQPCLQSARMQSC